MNSWTCEGSRIQKAIENGQYDGAQLKLLGEIYSYGEIRIVLAHLEFLKERLSENIPIG
jgi:hypothetical protein